VIFDPTNGYVYVPSNFTNLTVLDGATNSITDQIYLGEYASPVTPTYVSAVNRIYVPQVSTDPPPDNVSVINGSTNAIVTNISTGFFSSAAPPVYDPANHDLYVPDYGAFPGNVTVINTSSDLVVATIPVGLAPFTPAYDPADGDIYVPNIASNNMSIISTATNTVVGTIGNLSFPYEPDENLVAAGPVYDPFSQEVYQPNTANFTLTVIKGTSFVQNISVGPGPLTPLVDPANGDLYVPVDYQDNYATPNNTVDVVNPSSNAVITTIAVGTSPYIPVYDPANGEVYVSNYADNTVSAVNASTNQVVATIGVWFSPVEPVFDPANDELFVPNYVGNNVTVIAAGPLSKNSGPGTYPVTFTETGLTAGVSWNSTLDGTNLNSTSSSIIFNGVLNGTHPYTIGPWGDPKTCALNLPAHSGDVNVSGSAVMLPVPFSCSGGPGSGSGGSGTKPGILGLPGDDGYLLLAGIATAIVAVAAILFYVRRKRPPQGGVGPPPEYATPPPPVAWIGPFPPPAPPPP
jgi:YVTN family beta-propeller protein